MTQEPWSKWLELHDVKANIVAENLYVITERTNAVAEVLLFFSSLGAYCGVSTYVRILSSLSPRSLHHAYVVCLQHMSGSTVGKINPTCDRLALGLPL